MCKLESGITTLRLVVTIVIFSVAAWAIDRLCIDRYVCDRAIARTERTFSRMMRDDFDSPAIARQNVTTLSPFVGPFKTDVRLMMDFAACLRFVGDNERARQVYSTALKYNRRPEVFLNLGRAELALNERRAARTHFIEGARFAPYVIDEIDDGLMRAEVLRVIQRTVLRQVAAPPVPVTSLSVQDRNRMWATGNDGSVWKYESGTWSRAPGTLESISVGCDGAVWGIGANNVAMEWTGASWTVRGTAISAISVGNARHVAAIRADGTVLKRDGEGWSPLPGHFQFVNVDCAGKVRALDQENVYTWAGGRWASTPAGLRQVAFTAPDRAWGVNYDDLVWQFDGRQWFRVDGLLRTVSAAPDGTVMGVDEAGEIYEIPH